MTSTSLTYQDTNLAYYTSGEGFPLVFIHGFCEDHSIWMQGKGNDFLKPFIENYRVILPDIPGFGKSLLRKNGSDDNSTTQPRDVMHGISTTMDYYTDCIKAILDAEKIAKCVMIGHSMGGYITMNFASRFPDHLKGFGLFHSTAYADDDAKKADREKAAAFVRKNGSAPFVNELYSKLFGSAYKDAHAEEIAAIKKYASGTSSVEGIAQASLAMRDRKDTTEILKQSTVPVLFIIGKEDKAISPEKTLQLTHLPERSVICVLEKAGHMGMIEEADQCRKAIEELLHCTA
ncbi:MAG TPA: alpha/beta hydrolase [Chitinophagales bacterium]|nr:alpha/beta hydrolase [Chitinophagales bacterium]